MTVVLAYDLGASSGRLTAQNFDGDKLTVKEIYRFVNEPKKVGNHFFWDYQSILKHLQDGLTKIENNVASLGIDTWGVDFGFLNKSGRLLCNPYSYRDTHSIPYIHEVTKTIPHYSLYKRTGNEISSINTLFQLMSIHKSKPKLLGETAFILMLPNLFAHALSNEKINEWTIASTTQLTNIQTKDWDEVLIDDIFGGPLPLCHIEMPHQMIGRLVDYPSIKMALVPGHDTACALSALPIANRGGIFISLGTWGLIGKEVQEAVLTDDAFKGGFTNEGTSEGTYRFQKNATGFWILQQLRKEWRAQGKQLDFQLEKKAFNEAKPFRSFINPEDECFFNPTSMSEAIRHYCIQTSQPIPNSMGDYIRCFNESVAIHYANVVEQIERLTNESNDSIYIGGGGVQNETLCQLIANATGKSVYTGPIEASSIGNGLSQLRALGEIASIEEGRQIVRQSFDIKEYEPENTQQWAEMKVHYEQLI